MRAPLTPLKAFVHDAARRNNAESIGRAEDPRLSQWLNVAQAAERLATMRGSQREEYASRLGSRVLPERDERPTQVEGDGRAPADALSKLGERLRVEAEDMERAGCFELARTTVSSVCQMLSDAPATGRLLAMAHLGRVNRQIGDLTAAVDCYQTVASGAHALHDGPIASHAYIGLGNVAHQRGNRPRQKSSFERALASAARGSPQELSAHQGLMIVANAQNELVEALLHGWRAHDLAPADSEEQLAMIGNLSSTALYGGFYLAALNGALHVLQFSRVAFHRLPAIGGGMRAAAHLRRIEDVVRLYALCDAERAQGAAPFDSARLALWAAEAWKLLGDHERATALVTSSLEISDRWGFHELRLSAEDLIAVQPERVPVREREASRVVADDPNVLVGIGRLEALALA